MSVADTRRSSHRCVDGSKVAGTLRRAVRNSVFARAQGERHIECAYYFDFYGPCLTSTDRH